MSMYLTRFPLNISRRKTKAMASDPYSMHAAIAASFPPSVTPEEGAGRVLWRIDRLKGGGAMLYIASPTKPSLIGLDEQIGWPDLEPQWETRDYDPLLSRLEEGQRWAFRLVANPVVNRSSIRSHQGAGHSKRLGHLTTLQQAAWLIGGQAYDGIDTEAPDLFARQGLSRAERAGFRVLSDPASEVPQLVVSDSKILRFGPRQSHDIALSVARFDGLLEVVDADALRSALVNGIGHGKGFGCGLLTLAPIKE